MVFLHLPKRLQSSFSLLNSSILPFCLRERYGALLFYKLLTTGQGNELSVEEEHDIYITAYKQLNVALEFYQSNADKVPLPYPNRLGNYFCYNIFTFINVRAVPLIKTQLSQIQALPSILRQDPLVPKRLTTAVKSLADAVSNMRDIFLEHRYQ